jgi:septal ring factor EnvC (AmiA/AmiB activator)
MGGNKYSERLKQFTIALQKQRAAAEAKAAAEVAAAEAEAEAAAAEMPSEDGADDTMPTAPGIAPRGDVTRRNSSSNYYEQ